jgi:phosphomannomutase
MGVFKTYDIRGIYGEEITEELAYRLGRALARHTKAKTCLAGYDARLHSAELYRRLLQGLADEGVKATGLGLTSTPQLHYYQVHECYALGVMVTASHNPPQYHGFKVYDDAGGSISYAKGLDKIEKLVTGRHDEAVVPGGSVTEMKRLDEYIDFVCSPLAGRKEKIGLKAVIDPGNGSSGHVFRALIEKLGLDAVIIHEEPDGRFPNRSPNPLNPESREKLTAAVLETGADFGAGLDGDGDRLLFVDERGEALENYFLGALISEALLEEQPGSAIVYDLISSRVLPERIAELEGRPVTSKVGYTFLYDEMVASGAVFGCETSGHVYFRVSDSFYTESAAYALVLILGLLSKKKKPLSELAAPLKRRYVQLPEWNVEVRDKAKVMAAVEARFSSFAGAEIGKLDGVSVSTKEAWFNIRPSNTEPLLRIRLEAVDAEAAAACRAEIAALLQDA